MADYDITCGLGNLRAENYSFIFVKGTLHVGKATLTVTANDQARPYGDGNPSFDAIITGFKNGQALATSGVSGTPGCTSAAGATSPVADYDIICTLGTLAAANYSFEFAKGTLHVGKANLTVIADNKSMSLNGTFPALTGTLTGVKNNDGITASYSTTGDGHAPGSFPISPSLSDPNSKLGNYQVTITNGKLTVLFAPATSACVDAPGRTVLQPVNSDGSSVFKQGSTVPVKFRVCDANGASIGAGGPVVKVGSDGHRAPVLWFASNTTGPIDEAVVSTTPDTDFRWDATSKQWIFNLSTKNLKSGVRYSYRVDLTDGTSISFDFGTK